MNPKTPPIVFTKVALPFGWLGNMAPFPIEYAGMRWRTAEALFQALHFDAPSIREKIHRQTSPMAAKFVAKRHPAEMIVQPRSPQDVQNMRLILRLKIDQHPDLQKALLETGDREIIEDSTKRPNESGLFWGAAHLNAAWQGQNILGKLWAELRSELRNQPTAK